MTRPGDSWSEGSSEWQIQAGIEKSIYLLAMLGVVRGMRTKDDSYQSTCGKERKLHYNRKPTVTEKGD